MAISFLNFTRIRRRLRNLKGRIHERLTGRQLHRPDYDFPKETIGTLYGSHTIKLDFLDANSVVYSFGIGEDISFDLGLIGRYGCRVYAFDPTPKSVAWVQSQVTDPRFKFAPVGIASHDGKTAFISISSNHVSLSKPVDESEKGRKRLSLEVKTLSSIMKDLGHLSIDCLKMDVEGFEYEVVRWLGTTNIRPRLMLIEFHHWMYDYQAAETKDAVERLRSMGYQLFHVSDSGREYSFWLS